MPFAGIAALAFVALGGIDVAVYEGATGLPRPDAALFVIDVDRLSSFDRDRAHRRVLDRSWVEAHGTPMAIAPTGVATVPDRYSADLAFAFTAGSSGRTSLFHFLDVAALELWPDDAIELLVVDDQGVPQVDVPVRLLSRLVTCGMPGSNDAWTGKTGSGGRAVIAGGWRALQEARGDDGGFGDHVLYAALGFVHARGAPIALDPRRARSEPVVLVTPPRASVEFWVRTSEGRRIERPLECAMYRPGARWKNASPAVEVIAEVDVPVVVAVEAGLRSRSPRSDWTPIPDSRVFLKRP